MVSEAMASLAARRMIAWLPYAYNLSCMSCEDNTEYHFKRWICYVVGQTVKGSQNYVSSTVEAALPNYVASSPKCKNAMQTSNPLSNHKPSAIGQQSSKVLPRERSVLLMSVRRTIGLRARQPSILCRLVARRGELQALDNRARQTKFR